MRSLLLILKILVTTSLLIHPIELLASSSKIHSGKKGVKKNMVRDAGNVWERIRFGMQIPVFSALPHVAPSAQTTIPSQGLPENSAKLQKNVLIKTTLLPTLNYDENKRTKLTALTKAEGNEKAKSRLSADIQKQIVDYVNESSASTATALPTTRIRTRLEFHPRTDKKEETKDLTF